MEGGFAMPLAIIRNDITLLNVDAIVNAANETLLGGGGVDGAIHRAAGKELKEYCRKLNGCKTGDAKITPGFNLPAKYVIHTVGPVWRGGESNESNLLVSCYWKSLHLAKANKCESIAFPLISTGAYGYPKEQAFRIAQHTIQAFLKDNDMMVYLVVFDRDSLFIGRRLFKDVQQYIDQRYVDEHTQSLSERMRRQRNLYGTDGEWTGSSAMQRYGEEFCTMPAPLSREDADFAPCKPATPPPKAAAPQPKDEAGGFWKKISRKRKAPKDEQPPMPSPAPPMPESAAGGLWEKIPAGGKTLKDALEQMDEGFSETLLRKIDEKGMTDAQCYKKANIDRKLFSKIRNDKNYKPSKRTAVALCVALELDIADTMDLLSRAGFALTHASKFDIIIEYFILNRNFDIFEINETLFYFDQPLLGV